MPNSCLSEKYQVILSGYGGTDRCQLEVASTITPTSDEQLFRWLFVSMFVAAFAIYGYFRYQARQSGETIARVLRC